MDDTYRIDAKIKQYWKIKKKIPVIAYNCFISTFYWAKSVKEWFE